MKARYLSIVSLLFMGFAAPIFAQEKIDSFASSIVVQADSSIVVTENIFYDFSTLQRHGIYRDIPLKYKATYGNYSLRMRDISVTDSTDAALPFTTSHQGKGIRIRIGDPSVLISGAHEYRIQYRVDNAVSFHKEYDELYWNVTGNAWEIPIGAASADIVLPKPVEVTALTTRCFAGPFGSDMPCSEQSKGHVMHFGQSDLAAGDGLTFVVQFPKGIVTEPTATQKAMSIIKDNGIVAIPIVVLAIMSYLWYTKGRDPKGRGVIIAEYDAPDHLTPAQVGTLLDESTDNKDISAEVLFLAIQGYLKINQESDDYLLQQLKPIDDSLADYQQILMRGFFEEQGNVSSASGVLKEVHLSDLKNKFFQTTLNARAAAMRSVVKKGYFAGNPTVPKALYTLGALVFGVIGVLLSQGSGLAIGSVIVSAICIVLFGWHMSKRTYQGVLTKESILGLKEYLQVAEADRLKFHNAPEKKPEIFEKLLPYAMVLGVEKQWAEQFKGIYTQEPQWYRGATPGSFNTAVFVGNLSSFSSKAGSTLSSSPSTSSGGGGFSGGGGGGGGGGSW